jgi:hypothetical protein
MLEVDICMCPRLLPADLGRLPRLVDRELARLDLDDGSACSGSILRLPSRLVARELVRFDLEETSSSLCASDLFLCFLPRLPDRGLRLVDSSPSFRLCRRLRLGERGGSSFLLARSRSDLLDAFSEDEAFPPSEIEFLCRLGVAVGSIRSEKVPLQVSYQMYFSSELLVRTGLSSMDRLTDDLPEDFILRLPLDEPCHVPCNGSDSLRLLGFSADRFRRGRGDFLLILVSAGESPFTLSLLLGFQLCRNSSFSFFLDDDVRGLENTVKSA